MFGPLLFIIHVNRIALVVDFTLDLQQIGTFDEANNFCDPLYEESVVLAQRLITVRVAVSVAAQH